MRGEGKGQAQSRGELRSEQTGAQYPDRHIESGTGIGADCLASLWRLEIEQQLHHVLGKVVSAFDPFTAQCARGTLVGSRRAAQSKIDPPRMKRFERAELLGNHQRR